MARKDSKRLKIETALARKQEDSSRFCELSTTVDRRKLSKSGFLKLKYYNTKDIFFQHMAVKEKNFDDRTNGYEETNRFTNGYMTQHLTSVDIEEILRDGGVVIENFEDAIIKISNLLKLLFQI